MYVAANKSDGKTQPLFNGFIYSFLIKQDLGTYTDIYKTSGCSGVPGCATECPSALECLWTVGFESYYDLATAGGLSCDSGDSCQYTGCRYSDV